MSKRQLIIIIVFLGLFSSLTLTAANAKSSKLLNGGFWSTPVEAAQIRFTDLERGPDGIIHLLGFDDCCPGQILYTQRDLGGNWISPETVDNDVDSFHTWQGDLAVGSDGTAHAIWTDQEGGSNHKVKYAQRPSGGSWTSPITISDPAHDVNDLALLINSSNQLYASWISYGTPGFYTRHQVGGIWGAIQRVDMNQPPLNPIMLMDSQQNVHYFWLSGSQSDEYKVYYRRQTADNNWGSVTPISNSHTQNTDTPSPLFATLEGQNIHATWAFERNFIHEMYYAEYSGGSWSSPQQLNSGTDSQHARFLGAASGNVYIISYSVDDQSFSYYFRPSGGSWTDEPINFMGTMPRILALVSTDNTFHLVWDTSSDSIQYRFRQNLAPWSAIEPVGSHIGFGGVNNTIKQKGQYIDMGWENNGLDSSYAYAQIQLTNLPPQSYIPAVLK